MDDMNHTNDASGTTGRSEPRAPVSCQRCGWVLGMAGQDEVEAWLISDDGRLLCRDCGRCDEDA
ncbi:MAG TPA: hypothetical protein VE987_19440 [Polyangiaceae bacterium]|nr:hypothetical protein [Polyangiaceae bacterium]